MKTGVAFLLNLVALTALSFWLAAQSMFYAISRRLHRK